MLTIGALEYMDTRCKVFTPPDVATYMLDIVGYSDNLYGKKVIENSCGEGNILCAIVQRYIDNLKGASCEYIRHGLQRDIVGYDIDEEFCKKAKSRLDEIALKYGISDVKWNITCANALSISAEEQYDFVIGNPPYISYRSLDIHTRKYLKENFVSCKVGSFDYCYAFIEHAINSLKPNGKMIYLIPSSIFKNVHGENLRNIMFNHLEEICDYTSKKLFGKILTSSALISCVKGSTADHVVYRNIALNTIQEIPKSQFRDKWTFENISYTGKARFGDYFSASIVVATLLNAAYVLSNYEEVDDYIVLHNGQKIEKSVTMEAASPRSLRNQKKERIIFPYFYKDGNLMKYSEKEFMGRFPLAVEHLSTYMESLNKRDSDKQAKWFEYGRSQALRHLNQNKLLISTIITGKVEVYTLEADCVPYAGIFITQIGDLPLDVARRILTSLDFVQYSLNIGIYANGHSVRITPSDIHDFIFDIGLFDTQVVDVMG